MKRLDRIDQLLEKSCYIIDFLPEQVKPDAGGQFFEVEHYLLYSKKRFLLKDKFVNVILKLMCYYRISILWKGWIDQPKPEMIEHAVSRIMAKHSGTLDCLFPDENVFLILDCDCLNLSVYNSSARMQKLLEQIALSEGLFGRLAE